MRWSHYTKTNRSFEIRLPLLLTVMFFSQGSGHTVPEYKPQEAFAFYSRWLAGSKLWSSWCSYWSCSVESNREQCEQNWL